MLDGNSRHRIRVDKRVGYNKYFVCCDDDGHDGGGDDGHDDGGDDGHDGGGDDGHDDGGDDGHDDGGDDGHDDGGDDGLVLLQPPLESLK
ncbi:hypothetical protein [Nitrosomonas sp. Nm33]|uniref:hypothetical protein n=1 Tax=Nitrosomonas sp. Nm33 TaxID=133724 RepID=UPI00089590D2|nr:hypothetical protein [Nitrosomonas sp. Nm33]SDY95587.1 hypothetical protein SAMN05421755_107117 [Nitrosomonas sp. Nm33]